MDTQIKFSPQEVYSIIMAICITITTVSTAIAVIVKAYQLLKKPEKTQNERISVLESEVSELKKFLDNDNKRLKTLEEGNRVTQQAILALLSHALNGNDMDSLKSAKTKLENYLIGKEEDK